MLAQRTLDKKQLIQSFLLKGVLVYIVWQIAFIGFIKPEGSVDSFLTTSELQVATWGLKNMGVAAHNLNNIIYIDGSPAVRLEHSCNGLELIVLYIGFLLCFPGNFKSKILYSIIGSAFLFFANILREILLALNYHYFHSTFEFNHKYTYAVLTYILVFLFWKHWLQRYSLVANKEGYNF